MAPRVFVVNFSGHDYTKGVEWGELVPVTRGYIVFTSLDRVRYLCAAGIANAVREDYLLMSGPAILCTLCALLWFQRHGTVQLLNFDPKTDKYRLITVTGDNIDLLMKHV